MTSATPAQRDLARWLLAHEMGDRRGPDALSDATERACQKLWQRLARLVTVAGGQALLARALYLAGVEFPFMQGVRVGATPKAGLEGLRERVQGVEPARARDGLAAVLANLIWLLVTFIGDDLALRLIRDVWPEVPLGETGFGIQEAMT